MKKNENIHHKGSKEISTGEGSEGNEGGEKKQYKRKEDGLKEDKVHEEKQRKRRHTSATNDEKELKLKNTPTNDSVFETPIKKIEVDGEFDVTNVVGVEVDNKLMKKAAEGSSQSRDSRREGYILKLREKINWLKAEKSILETMIEEAIVKFPDDERFIKYRDRLYNIYKGRCDRKEEDPTGSCTAQTEMLQDHDVLAPVGKQLDPSDELFDVKVGVDDVCEEGGECDLLSPTTG